MRLGANMQQIYTGIDIGTYHVKVVIAEASNVLSEPLRVIGIGSSASKGMRHGYIVNTGDATRSIKEALKIAQQASKRRVRSVRVALGGVGLDELHSTGEVPLTTSGGEVESRDIDRAIEDSEKRISAQLVNRKVIHAIPIRYRVDGKDVLGRAVGMRGSKLSVDTLLITAFEQHLADIIEAVEEAGVEVEDVMASPLAASLVTLTKAQKIAGVVLANIGAETLSIAIFENDVPVSVKVMPSGSSDITNDIALSMKVSLTEAEQMKRGAITKTDVSRKKVEDVVASRLKDIFGLIDAHLKVIDKHRLLPAGIVITGGGSGLTNARDLAKATLHLPSQIGSLPSPTRAMSTDATWAVAFGLCRWGYSSDQREHEGGLSGIFSGIGRGITRGLRSLLP